MSTRGGGLLRSQLRQLLLLSSDTNVDSARAPRLPRRVLEGRCGEPSAAPANLVTNGAWVVSAIDWVRSAGWRDEGRVEVAVVTIGAKAGIKTPVLRLRMRDMHRAQNRGRDRCGVRMGSGWAVTLERLLC